MDDRKPKLEVLDAMRGFCALVVLLLHFTENFTTNGHSNLVPHGYLPVEYFFFLTGFTFVYAYDWRWQASGLTVLGFFRRRLLRMHPLVVIGTVFGAMIYLLVPEYSCMRGGHGLGWFALATVWCLTLIPMPSAMGWTVTHAMQPPLWTMCYIYFANIVYALVLRHLKTWMIGLLAVGAAVLSYYVGVNYGRFGKGWMFNAEHVIMGLGRLAYPVLAGMFIARKGWKINTGAAGLPVCLAILAVVFVLPIPTDPTLRVLLDPTLAVFVFPVVILCGAGGEIRNERLARFCRFMGVYSFPLYATHYPLRIVHRAWLATHPDASTALVVLATCSLVFFSLVNGWVAMKLVDGFNAWTRGRKER